MLKIALDAMGGDKAPGEIVRGALEAVSSLTVEVMLVGLDGPIKAELNKYPANNRISVVSAEDTIDMGEHDLAREIRRRPKASINVAMGLVKSGQAQGVVSAGNTAAVMTSAFFSLGRLEGIERPAIGIVLPFNEGRVFLIDAGANVDCRPSHLVQFAKMGSVYMEKVVGIARPRVGLLNNGEEFGKGSLLLQEAYEALSKSGLRFVGNVEGNNVHKGIVDVVVADGLMGNTALKAGEGVADYILQEVTKALKTHPLYALLGKLFKPTLRRALGRLRYEEYGGANLLGTNGVVVIAHGRSDAVAIKNAIRLAVDAAGSSLVETMRSAFAASELAAAGN
jgi:glycerol-3-phosphate acyltransferase PlsX